MAGFTGGCLCGAVRFTCSAAPAMCGHCHCLDCRRASGTGHCTHLAVPEAGLTVEGALTRYDRPADSGNLVSRFFCPACGSPILSRNAAMPGMAFLRASALDDPELVRPTLTVYAARAISWDQPDPALPAFPRMPEGALPVSP